jgi:SnoaL-like protein
MLARPKADSVPPSGYTDQEDTEFAQRWIGAWSSRNLERLLSLFDSDGSYANSYLSEFAQGPGELRDLFGRIFHGSDLRVIPKRVGRENGNLVVAWERLGTRIFGVRLLQEADQAYALQFDGTSVLSIQHGRVLACQDHWGGLARALERIVNEASRQGPLGRVILTPTEVIVNGVRIPRNI